LARFFIPARFLFFRAVGAARGHNHNAPPLIPPHKGEGTTKEQGREECGGALFALMPMIFFHSCRRRSKQVAKNPSQRRNSLFSQRLAE
jgi:hypothetical protein